MDDVLGKQILAQLQELNRNVNKTRFITSGQVPNPYREFTITIANNAVYPVYYSFNYFRLLTATSTTGLTFRFGDAGTETGIVGAGIGFQLPDIVNTLFVRNQSGGSVTITFAVAVGLVDDNRLNISGNVTVINPAGGALTTTSANTGFNSNANVAMNSATATSIIAAGATTRKTVFVTNTSSTPGEIVYIGDSAVNNTTEFGIPLYPGQCATIDSCGAIFGISATGTPTVAVATISGTATA